MKQSRFTWKYPGWGIFLTKTDGWLWLNLYPLPFIGVSIRIDKLPTPVQVDQQTIQELETLKEESRLVQ